jgi:hypothetical protein
MVKVRISGLDEIPWFFVFTEGDTPNFDSWLVQIEIIQATMIGNAAQDEDFPPNDANFDPNNFHFHGFGQPRNGPPPPPPTDAQQPPPPDMEHLQALG